MALGTEDTETMATVPAALQRAQVNKCLEQKPRVGQPGTGRAKEASLGELSLV